MFEPIHPRDIAERLLSPDVKLGEVDMSTMEDRHIAKAEQKEEAAELAVGEKPGIETMLNAFDFEAVARITMPREGWAYYSSGADDEITLRENHNAFQRIWLRPRILVDVERIDMSTKMLGHAASLPLYITATALGKLAHPDGECALTRAAYSSGIIQMLPTLSSCSVDEMLDARGPGQIQFSQLYVNKDRSRTKEYIDKIEKAGVKALFITVDAPQLGRREKDMRNKMKSQGTVVQRKGRKEQRNDKNNSLEATCLKCIV